MKDWRLVIAIICTMTFVGCAALRPVSVIKNESISNYTYVYITPTVELSSSTGGVYGGNYGVYGSTQSKSINPSDVIAGVLLKNGYTRLPQISPDLLDETLIVNYGESGRRNTGLGSYTIEVTIQFLSARTHNVVCTCTGEGQGATEADDIRIAINRCLEELLSEKSGLFQ